MLCGSCGANLADDNSFCEECGEPVGIVCPSCGATARAGKRFCGKCGSPLAPPLPRDAPATHSEPFERVGTPELRRVSVMFVDLVNYTAWSESRDADDVRELLSGYFQVARTVIGRYGGVVEKFIGDAVMAVWGVPTTREDDAELAVRAGLEMVAAVAEFGRQRGLSHLQARAGVVTGQAATWESPGEGLVTGDRVNTAARAQSAAEPGTVLVDTETRDASHAAIAYEPATEHRVKGKAEPLVLSRALRVVAGVGGAQRVDGLEAGFIGRARELALVKELFHASEETARARLVSVVGAAGVGKSRLAWEFEKYVDGLLTTVRWHRGRCLSYGEGVAFWALAEMVRQRFGIAEEDPSGVAAASLDAGLPTWVSDPVEREFVRSRLAVLIGAAPDVELSREELFAGWRLFLERLADSGPVVLLVEDLQWADSGLLDFLQYLLDWSAESSIFVLTLARPELLERRPGWLADRRNATTVHLEPLTQAAIGELLEALVPGMPDQAKRRIAERAAGVPLYAVEIIRTLVDRDIVIPEHGVYRLVADPGELAVPVSLSSLLGARLDGLPADERQLVKGLAVLGSSFPRTAVTAVSDAPAAQIDGWLDALVRKEILAVRSDPLSPERGQYAFVQSMLRVVAHDTLTKRERHTRHLAVATHLRSTFANDGEEVAEVIAAHYHDAYTAAPDEVSADSVRALAVEAFERAGRRAGAVGAPDAAQQAYLTAAELATSEPVATRLTEEAALMCRRAGRPEEALAMYQVAAAAHQKAGRRTDAARLATRFADCLWALGRGEEAVQPLREALRVLGESDTGSVLALVHGTLARSLYLVGGAAEAIHHVETALTMGSSLELPDVLARALDTKALLLQSESRTVEAVAMASAAADVAHRHGLTEREATARGNLGDILWQADLPGAFEEFEGLVSLSNRLGDRGGQSFGLVNLSLVSFFRGQWDIAAKAAKDALGTAPDELLQAYSRYVLVQLDVATGNAVEAEAHLPNLAILAASDDPQDRAAAGVARSAVALLRGRPADALELTGSTVRATVEYMGLRSDGVRLAWPLALRAALEASRLDEAESLIQLVADAPRGHVPPYLRAQLARYRGLVDAANNRHDSVEASLLQAIAGLRDLQYPYWLALTQVDLARWLVERERAAEAAPLVEEAVDTFTRLGARPDLDAARPLLAQLGAGAASESLSAAPAAH